ncbi:hypothetical protein H490_0103960 [Leucobacter sp. UCD-THU]|uniref:hypothetical protein n=1 Tax=Leucobacter sp. UCD-THU TaxID=1292023 RepID=UPI000364808F|nr:hypothetical protein [Leucobacter sp. UCD-THU]EYT56036.1 hypothetical protein H490_0103960 [Leucobacter sp. UCD-THU]
MKHTRTTIIGGPAAGSVINIPSGVTSFVIGEGPAAGAYLLTPAGAELKLEKLPAEPAKGTKKTATRKAPRTGEAPPPAE